MNEFTLQDNNPVFKSTSRSGKRKKHCAHAKITSASPYKIQVKEIKNKKPTKILN